MLTRMEGKSSVTVFAGQVFSFEERDQDPGEVKEQY